jgi:hypothetical protein
VAEQRIEFLVLMLFWGFPDQRQGKGGILYRKSFDRLTLDAADYLLLCSEPKTRRGNVGIGPRNDVEEREKRFGFLI